MLKSRQPLVIEVLRGAVVESSHSVMAVIANEKAQITGLLGNSDYLTPPRSCIKMLQAIPFLESGAIEKFELDDRMIALACSSHHGEKEHLTIAGQWMEKIHGVEGMLRCGAAYPSDRAAELEMIQRGQPARPIVHNCSGKHLGLISTALALGEDPAGYHEWKHPVQARLRKVLSEMTGFNHEKAFWGIDGCGIPTYAIPLQNLAIGMASLITMVNSPAAPVSRARAVKRILDACRLHPKLVSGTRDFVAAVTEKTLGRVLVKSGAEGTYAAIMPAKNLGLVVKVHDGNNRAAVAATAFLMHELGGLTDAEYADLKLLALPKIKNSRGEEVGEIRIIGKGGG